jgi:hypothetical protein
MTCCALLGMPMALLLTTITARASHLKTYLLNPEIFKNILKIKMKKSNY